MCFQALGNGYGLGHQPHVPPQAGPGLANWASLACHQLQDVNTVAM